MDLLWEDSGVELKCIGIGIFGIFDFIMGLMKNVNIIVFNG